MGNYTIYHNPRCSKSRETLEILTKHGISPMIIEYLKTPLTLEQLMALRLHFALRDFVRFNEPVFGALNLNLEDESTILNAMLKEPILMQRPIVTYEDKAIIGRPPEKVLDLLDTSLP